MRLNQLVFWGLLLEQAVSQSKSANVPGSITESPILKKIILLNVNEEQEQCTLEYREFKNSYLQFVNKPNYKDYITSYQGCFHKCCVELSFCKSFSYFPGTDQCFLMNVTRHDEGVEMSYSAIHLHVEMINPGQLATTETEDLSFTTTTHEINSGDSSFPPIIATTVPADIDINPTPAANNQTNKTPKSAHAVENPITITSNAPGSLSSKAVDTGTYSNNSHVTTISAWKFAQTNTTPMAEDTRSGDGKRLPSEDVISGHAAGNDATSIGRTPNVTQTATSPNPTVLSIVSHGIMISKFTTTKTQTHATKSREMPNMSPTSSVSNLKSQSSTVVSLPSTYVQKKYDITTASTDTPSATHGSSGYTVKSLKTTVSPTSSISQHTNTHSQPAGSSSTSSKISPPSVDLHHPVTFRTTTFRYSPTLSRLTTSRSRPPDTKRTSTTTKQPEKTKSKSPNGHVTRFVLKTAGKTNILNNQQPGRMDKLTSCGIECKNGGRCKIYRNIERTLKCRCKDGFKGEFCEKVIVTSKQGIFRITWWIILLIVVAIILFISVVATFFIFYIYKRKVGNYNLTKDRRFELASAYSPDRIDQALGSHYASLAWKNQPAQSLRSTDDANKSWIFCYFDNETRCESIYRMRVSN